MRIFEISNIINFTGSKGGSKSPTGQQQTAGNNVIKFPWEKIAAKQQAEIESLNQINAIGLQDKIITAYKDILTDHYIQMDQFSFEKAKGNIKELSGYINWIDFLADIQRSKHPMPLQGDPMPTPTLQWKHWIENLANSDEKNFLYRRLIWYVYPRLQELYEMYEGFVFDLRKFKLTYVKDENQNYVTVFEKNPQVPTPDERMDEYRKTMGIINTLRITIERYLSSDAKN